MEGSRLQLAQGTALSQLDLQPLFDLQSSLVGKGYGCDLGGFYLSSFDQVTDSGDQGSGLSGAGSRDDCHCRIQCFHCFFLLFI